MAEQSRLESSLTADAADRDGRGESLLVDGLDRYFAGQYEEAIHLWTRVLFLDRSHARARAYIDRARTAIAERQRQSEELLSRSGELIAGGQTDPARALLAQAVATGADDERVVELRARLERVERARVRAGAVRPPAVVDAVPIGRPRGTGWRIAVIGGALAAGALMLAAVSSPLIEAWVAGPAQRAATTANAGATPQPVLSRGDVALVRARTLYARGRLAEALAALDRVDTRDPQRTAADQLRVEIQQILLATRRGLTSARR